MNKRDQFPLTVYSKKNAELLNAYSWHFNIYIISINLFNTCIPFMKQINVHVQCIFIHKTRNRNMHIHMYQETNTYIVLLNNIFVIHANLKFGLVEVTNA